MRILKVKCILKISLRTNHSLVLVFVNFFIEKKTMCFKNLISIY